MKLRDKYGWPVVTIIGHPIVSFIRFLIHTNIQQTWKYRKAVTANPWTGKERDNRDVMSDTQAILCVEPNKPLKAYNTGEKHD